MQLEKQVIKFVSLIVYSPHLNFADILVVGMWLERM
jgi:hypothetical protein